MILLVYTRNVSTAYFVYEPKYPAKCVPTLSSSLISKLVLMNNSSLLDHSLLDPAVLAGKFSHELIEIIKLNLTDEVLPNGCKVQTVEDHGKTNWSSGFKVQVLLPTDEMKAYFMKVIEKCK